jgi:hypothetical protein
VRGSDSLLDEVEGLLQKHILQPIEHEAGFVVDPRCEFAGTRNQCLNCLHDSLLGPSVCDELDPRDERCRVGEVHAEEALGML